MVQWPIPSSHWREWRETRATNNTCHAHLPVWGLTWHLKTSWHFTSGGAISISTRLIEQTADHRYKSELLLKDSLQKMYINISPSTDPSQDPTRDNNGHLTIMQYRYRYRDRPVNGHWWVIIGIIWVLTLCFNSGHQNIWGNKFISYRCCIKTLHT